MIDICDLPCWFYFNNSETLKPVTLALCSIQELFIIDICTKIGIPQSPQSPYIGQNPDGGISDFRISGKSRTNENCHNSRTSNDIDMKFEPVTKPDKGNTITSKKIDYDAISGNYVIIIIFSVYGQETWSVNLYFH